jgi:hypothetical protein
MGWSGRAPIASVAEAWGQRRPKAALFAFSTNQRVLLTVLTVFSRPRLMVIVPATRSTLSAENNGYAEGTQAGLRPA